MFRRELINTLEDKVKELEDKIRALKREYKELESTNKNLESELEVLKDIRIDAIEECSFDIDFKKLNAISIERAMYGKREKTVIGYLKHKDDIGQWNFTCSRETHNRLAEQFKEQVLGKP